MNKTQAMNCQYRQELHYTGKSNCHIIRGVRGGEKEKIVRVRVTGKCQTWKTRPDDFRLPVRYGLRENSAVTPANQSDFHLPHECPLYCYPPIPKI